MSRLKAVDHNAPLGEGAYQALREAILTCAIPPGAILTEGQLMERLGVGKSTCRFALIRLAQEGFVRSLPRQGYMVTPITMTDVEELFAIRLLLEPEGARLATGKIDVRKLARIETNRRAALSGEKKNSVETYIKSNEEFHSFIAMSSGNTRLARGILGVLDEMRRLVAFGFVGLSELPAVVDDHRLLIAAFEEGDSDAAARILFWHIERTRDETIKQVLESIRQQEHALSRFPSGRESRARLR